MAPPPAPATPAGRCVVPKLKGKKLKPSRKALTKCRCVLWKVEKRRGAKARTGRVVKQSRNPRTVLLSDAQVTVTLKP
jgi:hypothetical protein